MRILLDIYSSKSKIQLFIYTCNLFKKYICGMIRVRLNKRDRENLMFYISDEDVFQGSDGHDYITEKALRYYYNAKFELDRTIKEIERGVYPHGT